MSTKKFSRGKIIFYISILFLCLSCHEKKNSPTPPPPVKVSVLNVSTSGNDETRSYPGTVSSAETTTVSFSVAGTISDLYAKEGQKVNKGQLLGKIRNGEYLNAYNIAKAQLDEAQDAFNRLKKLHDANALPDIKWVEIQQKLEQAKNATDMAKRTLDDASLFSPVSGTVTKKFADVGQTIIPVEPIFEIVSTTELTFDVPVTENEISLFETGQSATVVLESQDIKPVAGKVSQKTVVADPVSRSFTVKVDIPNTDGRILPGMIGNAKFETVRNSDAPSSIILPSQAVLLDSDNRLFVWVVVDSVAKKQIVTADELVANGVKVLSGLNPGDQVIVEGMLKVGNGTKVVTQTIQ